MKKCFLFIFLSYGFLSSGQNNNAASTAIDSGKAAYNVGNYHKAVGFFNKALEISKRKKDTVVSIMAENNLGNAYSQLGHSDKALLHYHQSIKLSRSVNDTLALAKALKNAGTLYSEQKDFKTAVAYYQEAYKLSEKLNNPDLTADCLNNLGVVYEQEMKFEQALEAYQKALSIYTAAKDDPGIAMTLNNLAIVYKCLKKYPEAIKNYKASLAISEKLGDRFIVAANQNNLGNVYALIGDFRQSLELCLLANANAKAIAAKEIIVESYDGIATAYENLGQLPKALFYRKAYEKEKESYINAERSSQLAQLQIQYETAQKESDIKILQQQAKLKNFEIQQQKGTIDNRNLMLIGAVVLLTILIALGWIWKSRQFLKNQLLREKAIRDTEEQERIRIAKDIHDDLGSGLSKINFLSELIFQKTENLPEVRHNSESVKETAVKMIGNMRDLIWALNPENTTLANLLSRIREYTTDYLEDYPIELQYSFPENVSQRAITKESHRELFMVVKETLQNIVKHAGATVVHLIVLIDSEQLSLRITDNGTGFELNQQNYGNGLRNIESRIKNIGGIVNISSGIGEGSQVFVSVSLGKILK